MLKNISEYYKLELVSATVFSMHLTKTVPGLSITENPCDQTVLQLLETIVIFLLLTIYTRRVNPNSFFVRYLLCDCSAFSRED